MNQIIHRADSRGHADHGWLNSYHTFSFAGYYDPSRMHFGALRVLNDDCVAPGYGFGMHPHDNMEIISIPIKGALAHKDSMGHEGIIREEEIQVMSAGTGLLHSEQNPSTVEEACFLQIWIFPERRGIQPRYDQVRIPSEKLRNQLFPLVGSYEHPAETWIHQRALISMGDLDQGVDVDYHSLHAANGLYLFLIEGEVEIGDQILLSRDAIGLTDYESCRIRAKKQSRVLLLDVPMQN